MSSDNKGCLSVFVGSGCIVQVIIGILALWFSSLGLTAIVHLVWGSAGVAQWYSVSLIIRLLIAALLSSGSITLGVVAFFIDLFTTQPLIS